MKFVREVESALIKPIVIAHRGASGYRPEHTLAAYELAIAQGANFIEPDLVATRDGWLICRHENALAVLQPDGTVNATDTSTDVYRRTEFAARLTTKRVDGREIRGWFSEDFTLADIKTLRAIERIPALRPANTAYDGLYEIPTFDEVITLVKTHEARTAERVGVYPETKHPSYFLHDGHRLDGEPIAIHLGERVLATLRDQRFCDPARVFIQSFEVGNLRELARDLLPRAHLDLPLIQLIEADGAPYDLQLIGSPRRYRELLQPAGLADIARYARGVGVFKQLVIPLANADALSEPTSLVKDAHDAGLLVHAWTFRAENHFLPMPWRGAGAASAHGDLRAELVRHLGAGLDGVFCDHPDLAVQAIGAMRP